ncbi:SepM family pheromone-processing serine protease [Terrilactibacillus laevilacticus]|uniref:endopeptidase La n=1 Tax=Terrilactibacillus laevilacticus TaxID=1380157 RepID=A0ABW5PQ92_9BACI|nr:SepM family pheromone-processing serine protease [Terrilactibacillus laevilacticus]
MRLRKRNRMYLGLIVVVIIALFLNFYKTPYFIQSPGSAQSIKSLAVVEDGQKVHGDFMLVYILVGQANVYQYLWAKYDHNKYTTLVKQNQVMMPDETDEEYNLRAKNDMMGAQKAATYIAYKKANLDPKVTFQGVQIIDVISSMPASKVLQPGDVIVGMEGKNMRNISDVQPLLKNKRPGESIHINLIRNGKQRNVTAKIGTFPKTKFYTNGKTRYGLGITQSNKLSIHVKPKIKFNIKNIGGPSAGLMMTLNIYDQLTKRDLAKGYKIAGTGTMEMDGSVGPIGGIEEKIVGADKSGADIFLAPTAENEYKDAERTAKEIGSKMKVIPVGTFDEAIQYLSKLKAK